MLENTHTYLQEEPFGAIDAFDSSIIGYCKAFIQYYTTYLSGHAIADRHLTLKMEHTLRVLAKAWQITAGLHKAELSGTRLAWAGLRRSALLASLFHDMGRFEQFSRFGTFSDALSVNHGILGAQALTKSQLLRHEPVALRRLVKAAVLLHNRQEIPQSLKGDCLFVLNIVRDADKLDILRVMSGFLGIGCEPDDTILLHLKDDPNAISPSFASFNAMHEPLAYSSMRYVNDFRIILLGWLGQMNFPQSCAIALEEGYALSIADGLQGVPAIREKAYIFLEEHAKNQQSLDERRV